MIPAGAPERLPGAPAAPPGPVQEAAAGRRRPRAPAAPPGQTYGSAPARRAATTASSRVCAPSFRIAERR